MSRPLVPPGVGRELSDDRRRLEVLERIPGRGITPVYFELVLEFPESLFVNQETSRYPARRAFSVTGYRFTGDTAGSTATTIQIRKISGDGATVTTAATITIPASTLRVSSTPLAIGYAANHDVQGNVSTAGTGAAGFCVILECVEA